MLVEISTEALPSLRVLEIKRCGYGVLQSVVRTTSSITKLELESISGLTDEVWRDVILYLGEVEEKSLQTLSKIIIGGDNGFAITELKELKNLCGDVSIKGLEKVQNSMHAREAQISQKRLSGLEVEWSNLFDGSRKETLEKEILNVLKPHTNNLKSLRVVSYGGVEFPNWVGDPSFLRLTHVSIRGCKKCTSLPPLGQLLSLKQLFIQGMHEVKFVGSELLGTGLAFPSLEFLSFNDMQGWKVWSTGSDHVVFPCLQELLIINCPTLVEISTEALPSLRVLEIKRCGYGVLQSVVSTTSSITKLELESISGLTDEVWRDVILYLGEVEEVRLDRCNEIRYFWVSEAHADKVLVNLRELVLWSCNDLVSLGEKEEDNCGNNFLTSLKMLEIWFCNSMTRCISPKNIQKLKIDSCSSITSVSLPTQKLKSVLIYDCKKLLEEELVGEKSNLLIKNKNMPMLENVCIRSWQNLKSITELSYFIHLRELLIEDCPSMESIPDREFPSLTLLKHMTILNCPSMDSSFPRGLWPLNLHSLVIGKLKKPISQWGQQNFPASLVHLSLFGGSKEDDVSSCTQLSHLLPSSLTSLHVQNFEKLESLSAGLQHLTSLRHLSIDNVTNMKKDMQEILFPSLSSLIIRGFPNLKERCSRRGCYWPFISHIPNVKIDGHYIH
ncbi:NB-ARC domains-containing protein [Artemisia annua]|uniref:NB-ARC domains-containing protein n=1 Tax=Artemisia annua TaxID=35608 RepID=A0A2U1M194_ARTAN|nr:NB-ARC domains-containing protein [Artemisia annua]